MTYKNTNSQSCDVLIAGAGPAGLAAAHGLTEAGLSVIVADSGKPLSERDRYAGVDITQGVGGAGLFSDGKFSFFPSASELWELEDHTQLQTAYKQVSFLLHQSGLVPPPFPSEPAEASNGNKWQLKEYPSFYLDLDDRLALTDRLVQGSNASLVASTTLSTCSFETATQTFTAKLDGNERQSKVNARYVIFAGGRFNPLTFPLSTPMTFERLEVGCRIEQPSDQAFFRSFKQLDPKLKLRKNA
jgi:uncharacterized FAD-dependent dehydrogenase